MSKQEKIALARDALAVVGERYGFMLSGSLAMDLWGLTPRTPHDIDLFAEPVRGRVVASEAARELVPELIAAGYRVNIEDVTANGRNVEILVTDPDTGFSAGLQLVEMTGVGQPFDHEAVGPLLSLEASIELKIEAFTERRDPKDFVDLAHIATSASQEYDEAYILNLLTGASADVDTEKYQAALRSAAEVPDGFLRAAYGAYDLDTSVLRETLTLLSTTVGGEAADRLEPNIAILLGEQALTPGQADAAFQRLVDGQPYTLLSDVDLKTVADDRWAQAQTVTLEARDARARAEREEREFDEYGGLTAGLLADLAMQFPGLGTRAADEARQAAEDFLEQAKLRADELEGIAEEAQRSASVATAEQMRRESLSPEDLAAESVLRRAATEVQLAEPDNPSRELILDTAMSIGEGLSQDQDTSLRV